MKAFAIHPDALTFIGSGLRRPECILTTAKGNIYTSDWRGGVSCIRPDGSIDTILADHSTIDLKPNGIALCRDGSFLIANIGDTGGLYRLEKNGELAAVLTEVDGVELPPSNYVMIDSLERTWLTVSTRLKPRARGYRPDVADGFIVLLTASGARIVADNLAYTNEIQLDASGQWLYVNETFGRKLSRFRVQPDGTLKEKETIAEFGTGTYPDGLTFDAEGGIWITSIISNRVIRISPDGDHQIILEDADPDHVFMAEEAFQSGHMDRPHLDTIKSQRLKNISSLAFGGEDLRTIYLGCLLGDSLATFRSPVAGRPPSHWLFDG
jgi:sugar lactone lactonase YvrE